MAIRLSWDDNLSLSDMGDILQDIEAVFRAAAREVTIRARGPNSSRRNGILVVREMKTGSLELLVDPYFQGVVSGIVANLACAVFAHALRRINGKPQGRPDTRPPVIRQDVMSEVKLKEAAQRAVELTTKPRQKLKQKMGTFKLRISINIDGQFKDISED